MENPVFDDIQAKIDAAPVLRGMVDDIRRGCASGPIAAGFHVAVAELIAETADGLREATGIERVALSGGVFQNVLLLRLTRAALAACDLRVLTHSLVPPNDGGLARRLELPATGWLRRYRVRVNGVPDAAALVVKGAIIAGAVWSQNRGRTA